ncbi:hypothetical protein BH11PLA1_BH11PLA1_01670 [soil metagenome]
MIRTAAFGLTALALAASAANASIAFSFADPVPGQQLSLTAGLLTYDTTAPINFIVDGTGEGYGSTNFANARLSASLVIGLATSLGGGDFVAPVTGTFTFTNAANGNTILSAIAGAGAFVRISNTGSLLFSSDNGLSYIAGIELTSFLPAGVALVPAEEAVFTVTDLTVNNGGPQVVLGVVQDFTANTSYSGNSAVIPTPGAMALLGLGGVVAGRRRR